MRSDDEYGTGCMLLIIMVGSFLVIGAAYLAFLAWA
jgi:hypothetical protein